MNRYILEPTMDNLYHAGSKAREDINYFLGLNGYKIIKFKVNDSRKFLKKVRNYLSCLFNLNNIMGEIEKDSVVLVQYPYPCRSIIIETIIRKLARKGAQAIALIHDVDSLRMERCDKEIYREITYLNTFHHVISHNPVMTEWLKSRGLKKDIVDLDIFDYRMSDMDITNTVTVFHNEGRIVVFAGNLSKNKSQFLYGFNDEILKGLNLHLYGIEYDEKNVKCSNIKYMGVFEPDELPWRIEGDFGLIWDGTDINTCAGHYGQYLRYNNPHKLSLYIAAGIPVITWKNAAISGLVSKNKIGIMVDSLSEISDAISEINDEQYLEMKSNVQQFKDHVTKGQYIQNAVKKIEESIMKGSINEL